MAKKAAVFCCKGLGDGLISLILSHNLQINGYEVITFHPFLAKLQAWFPQLILQDMTDINEDILQNMDALFFFYEKIEPMQSLIDKSLRSYAEKTYVLNPIATSNKDYPFWSYGKFDGTKPFADNLVHFCKHILELPKTEKSNGIVPPFNLQPRRLQTQVAIHPTSSREGKNWPKEKFLSLADRLKQRGFSPYFILTKEEQIFWQETADYLVDLRSLDAIASFIYESGYFIGNDSGLGHLASCLQVPTVTVCRSINTIRFWRPAWAEGRIVLPPKGIPNFKLLRLRDKYWKNWISIDKVEEAFDSLL